ncbi:DUF6074 family protein [Kaistia sp. UC242_56]|uniref:DUF6074 family protein n=1 Tax=Kaistia sp. UC242_56 TaxID=3374625 RepID=UPI0037BC2E26
MKGEQMDFFASMDFLATSKPADAAPAMQGRIVAFPVYREVHFVRRTAERMMRREGAARNKFWRTEALRLYGRLQVQGLCHGAIEAQIWGFAAAVDHEMQAISVKAGPLPTTSEGAAS